MKKRKVPVKRQQPPPSTNAAQAPNGAPSTTTSQQPYTNGVTTAAQPQPEDDGNWQEFPIFVSKNTLMQGLHYHAMKLQGRIYKNGQYEPINPYDQSQFTRPLQLHRRMARDKMAQAEQLDVASGMDDKDKELQAIKREERQREREANQAQIAPTGGDAKKSARPKPKKKVEDVFFKEYDEKAVKKSDLRYTEARPWHLEDFDHKNVFVGNYEEPPSEESVMFEIGENGFRMVPVEKWYRFTQANRVAAMEGDAIEKEMAKPAKLPRWFNKTQVSNDEARKQAMEKRKAEFRAQQRGGDEEEEKPESKDDYNADVDEMDFEFNDEFQDDDEGAMFGDQDAEDQKDLEKRLREEMRNAGLGATGIKDEDKDYDAEEEKQREEEKEEKRRTKRMRKALLKKERKNEYDDDSEHGEFSESSESEDSEDERERLEQERKQEEARKINGDKSGASTKGTNTPSGRVEKKDSSRPGNSLKRPGSPDLSELSGNESSRKRPKVNGASASNGARALSRTSFPLLTLIMMFANALPADTARGTRPPRTHTGGSGSGSETEGSNPREGRPKIRIRNSPTASPNGSRAATPSGSRAQSPQRVKRPPFPTLEEVRAAIPKDGIPINELVDVFRSRVAGRQADFISLVKGAGRQDPTSKRIMPKSAASP